MPVIEELGLPSNSKLIEYSVDSNGCWNITSHSTNAFGYASVQRGTRLRAHRHVYNLYNNTIVPDELVVRHKCDNPSCINPAHLETGTQQDNVNDMVSRGRNVNSILPGSSNGKAILNEEQVKEIRMDTTSTRQELAVKYNVTRDVIKDVDLRRTWKHVVVDEKYNYRPRDKQGKQKLTREQVNNILQDSTSTGVELAKKYNVSTTTISQIRTGKLWIS